MRALLEIPVNTLDPRDGGFPSKNIETSNVQLANDLLPSDVTDAGILTEVISLQLLKASAAIFLTGTPAMVSGISMAPTASESQSVIVTPFLPKFGISNDTGPILPVYGRTFNSSNHAISLPLVIETSLLYIHEIL